MASAVAHQSFMPAVIGTGAMGGAMASRLLTQGYPVQVRDTDISRQLALVATGAVGHFSPASLATRARVVFIVVVDAAQIRSVLSDDGGLRSALSPAHTVVFCSTISPEEMSAACELVRTIGAAAIDAPISGGPQRALRGEMSMMLACDPTAIEPIKPLLAQMTDQRFFISERPGDASRAKLVNNLVAGINLAAAAEGLALARALGLDESQMLELMRASSAQSWIGDDRMRRALDNDFLPRAQTHVLAKDLTLAQALAHRHGYPVPLGDAARTLFEAACSAGYREEDDAAMLKYRHAWRQPQGGAQTPD